MHPKRTLVLESDVLEQIGHRFLVVDSPDGLGDEYRYVDGLDFVALHLLYFMRNRVGDDDLVDRRLFDEARSVRAEQAVCGEDVDLVGAALLQDLGGGHKRCNVVDHVVLRGEAIVRKRIEAQIVARYLRP